MDTRGGVHCFDGYMVTRGNHSLSQNNLKQVCAQFNLDGFGSLLVDKNLGKWLNHVSDATLVQSL